MDEQDELAAIIASMREEYGGHAAASLAAIDALLGAHFQGSDSAPWAEIARQAHSLKGTGATFGFPEVSELAADVERLACLLPDQASFDAFSGALAKLRQAVASL